jgi:hypothetical protein
LLLLLLLLVVAAIAAAVLIWLGSALAMCSMTRKGPSMYCWNGTYSYGQGQSM